MSIYYKSVRIINGKPKRVIVDEYGDIIIGLPILNRQDSL